MSTPSGKSVSVPTVFEGERFHHVWDDLLRYLLQDGSPSAPRGKPIREQLNVSLHVRRPLFNILVNNVRNVGYRAMVAEWLWIAGGFNDLASLHQYNRNYAKFSDDGTTLYGAYGTRIRPVWNAVVAQLNDDRDTRQAVISIWSPDTRRDTKDTPCTLTFQFFARKGLLNLTVNMRSSDAWLGLPNDFYVFSQLLNEMAGSTELTVGTLTMNLGSSHLYQENFDFALVSQDTPSLSLRTPSFWHGISFLPELYQRFRDKSGKQVSVGGQTLWDLYAKILVTPTRVEVLSIIKEMANLDDE